MSKWCWLFLIILFWIGAGFAFFGSQGKQNHSSSFLSPRFLAKARGGDRIVSMAPNLTEILFALGLEDKIVGVTVHCNYPPAAAEKTKIGTFWQPNIEAVIAAKPTLVVTLGEQQQRSFAERLRRIGLHCLTVNIEKVSELFEAIERIGTATGKRYEANQLVTGIQEKLNRIAALVGTKDRVRVLWVVQREPLRVAGRDTFVNEMIELAGGENAIGPTVYKYPPIGAEQVIASGAEVIIEPSMTEENPASQKEKAIQYWSRFENVPAAKNGRIYVISGDVVSRLGPRLYEGVETIARCLRPELFAD